MAATADPRAKPPAAPPTHHLEPWARPQKQQPPPPSHASAARDRRRPSSSSRAGDDGGIEELRAKLMGHLRDAADRLRVSHGPTSPPPPPTHALTPPPPDPEPTPPPPPPPPTSQQQQEADAVAADKPWKLRERTRRRPAALTSWPTAGPAQRRRKRAPFSVALSPEEIEEDIYALTGGRPRRRPRKRPRGVQRQLDSLFPGLWLNEITADDYRVPDE